MPTTSRSKTITLIAAGAVIALAALLFANAMSLGEFSNPGSSFLSGQSNLRLVLAFGLLTGLALVLLVLLSKSAPLPADLSVSGRTRAKRTPGERSRHHSEEAALSVDPLEAQTDQSGGIISDTAEELRTSVEVIQEELEEMLEDEEPADKEHMQSLYEETDRLKKIIASMEQLSRAQEIAAAPKNETLAIEPLLKEIIEQTKLAVQDKQITYALSCEPGLTLQGDAECIRSILGNIAENAARFIKEEGTVTVTASRTDGEIVFGITDTGPGIRRAHLGHLYERFFRGAGTGIGMGLSIAKEMADACGGAIAVQTEVGKGTTFSVTLPAE